MSEYGHVNDDPQAVLRQYARSQDTRLVMRSVTVKPRKATRTRPSTLKVRVDPSIMHGPKSAAKMRHDADERGSYVCTVR